MSANAAIKQIVKRALPSGKTFQVQWQATGLGKSQILRIITPAWKTLPRYARVMKIQKALDSALLSASIWDNIFRVSVLTSDEFRRLQAVLPRTIKATRHVRRQNGERKTRCAASP